jgi:hypothetical protein
MPIDVRETYTTVTFWHTMLVVVEFEYLLGEAC